jgi:predicted CXXCH cytochrome family protein
VINHPVGVAPTAAVTIPVGWPLASDGSITCLTCHEALPPLDGGGGPRLRHNDTSDDVSSNADSVTFCAACHRNGAGRGATSAHWTVVGVAHVTPGDEPTGGNALVDAESRRCLECHDGVNAVESVNPVGLSNASFADAQRNHPIGMPYPNGRSRQSNARFRSASLLPDTVHLPGGNVSCVSCHNLYAGTPKLLSVPLEGSKLCFTCHDMD